MVVRGSKRVVKSSGYAARHFSRNSSFSTSCFCGLEQVIHPLCLGFPICKKGIIALPYKVAGMIKRVSRCKVCVSLQEVL